jgi:integrase
VLAYLKTFFVWAVDQELIEASPAAAVKRPSKEVKRDRVLTDWEIRAIWKACGELGAFGHAFRFMLATGQRRSEVGEMTWNEIERGKRIWALSRERTKADRAHEIPLSDLAMSIIDECPKIGSFVFSTGRSGAAKAGEPASPVAISGWSKAKAALDKSALEKARVIAIEQGERPPNTVEEWHLHDLRRTAATHMARIGIDRVVIAKVLNHAESDITAIYDRHRYDHEKRRALDLWGERLKVIVDGAESENVVQIATTRA